MVLGLIVANAVAFACELELPRPLLTALIEAVGIVPARFSDPASFGLTSWSPAHAASLLGYMFIHGGWLHLIGNMWALWLFGDNVEDRMGGVRFLIFYVACGLVAAGVHISMNPGSMLPTVGASGAIAGVMGAYVILFPRARILMLIPIFVYPLFVEVPAPALIFGWFGLQLYEGTASLSMHDHAATIAWWAHVGGFAVGALVALLMRGRAHRTPLMDDEGGAPEASGRLS